MASFSISQLCQVPFQCPPSHSPPPLHCALVFPSAKQRQTQTSSREITERQRFQWRCFLQRAWGHLWGWSVTVTINTFGKSWVGTHSCRILPRHRTRCCPSASVPPLVIHDRSPENPATNLNLVCPTPWRMHTVLWHGYKYLLPRHDNTYGSGHR